ncbi:hypothetical protein HanRHA438_Chr12g0562021 [Helianthus annuus]|nr:hypothetical protein HanRHA438_Chr12g0562021 [Helianthus annuus]
MERGSKYEAYANLRESKLRMKQTKNPPENQDSVNNIIPAKKPVKFQGQESFHSATNIRGKGAGLYAQSAAPVVVSNTRNDYRKPALPAVVEKYAAPAGKSCSKVYDISLRSGGYKSSVPEEKRKKGIFTAIRSSRRAMQTWMK